jgi:hypothetical protein
MYVAKAPKSERPVVDGTAHATVKPLDLMQWLVRLVTPPGGTVLEPFAGSGTTVEAALREGMSCIAIEREADYLPLIVARCRRPIDLPFNFEEPAMNRPEDPASATAAAGRGAHERRTRRHPAALHPPPRTALARHVPQPRRMHPLRNHHRSRPDAHTWRLDVPRMGMVGMTWQEQAVCREADPEVLFPENGRVDISAAARRLCAACPVRPECLGYALEHQERYGIWGGLSDTQRRTRSGISPTRRQRSPPSHVARHVDRRRNR